MTRASTMGLIHFPGWPLRYAGRLAQIRRDEGLLGLSDRILRRLAAPAVEWGRITFFERALDTPLPTPAPSDVMVREVMPAEAGVLETGLDPSQPREEALRHFRRGDRAFAAIDADGTCVHTRWVTTSRTFIPEIDREIVPGPRQAYFYNGYTRPESRGRGVDGLVRSLIFATLRSEGFTAVYSYVRGDNRAGIRAASRWQRPVGRVRYVRVARGRPFVSGGRQSTFPALARAEPAGRADDRLEQAWRRWFQSWTAEPLTKRSTGCAELPEAYFQSAAAYIASTLQLTSSDDVLDVGCDSAMISRLIAPGCRRFTGVDFIPEMLRDARARVMGGAHQPAGRFVAADARSLPLRTGAFTKVYCSAVLHTLPSRRDGLTVIDELIRVTADGGTVLISSVPDRAKRFTNRAEIWRRASSLDKATLPFRWMVPTAARRLARRLLRLPASGPPQFLDYDLREIARALEARGLTCAVRDFPVDYWSTDFYRTRSNLVVTVPGRK